MITGAHNSSSPFNPPPSSSPSTLLTNQGAIEDWRIILHIMSHTLHTQHTHDSSHILHTTQHHTLVFSHAPTLFYLIKHLPCNDDAITYINIVVKEERGDVSKQEYDRILYFLPSVCTKCISKYQNYSRTFPRTTLGRSSKKTATL